MALGNIKNRIERMRSGGLDGPSPTGFLLSTSASGGVMLVVHDLGLVSNDQLVILLGDGFVRLKHDGIVLLQTTDDGTARKAIEAAASLAVLETNGREPLRLHQAVLRRDKG